MKPNLIINKKKYLSGNNKYISHPINQNIYYILLFIFLILLIICLYIKYHNKPTKHERFNKIKEFYYNVNKI